MPSPVDNATGI